MSEIELNESEQSLNTAILGASSALHKKMMGNYQFCQFARWFVMQMLARFGRSAVNMDFSAVEFTAEKKIKFALMQKSAPNLTLVLDESNFERFIGGENKMLNRIFKSNRNFLNLFTAIASRMEEFCKWKHIDFGKLDFNEVLITKENLCIISLKEFGISSC